MPTKVHMVKAMVFPEIIYGCETWTIKKAECQKTDAFKLWCWRRFMRVPWTARRSNQWFLKEISPEYSLEGLMLKLKLQYFAHLMQRADSLEKTLMLERWKAGGEGDNRGWDGWMALQIHQRGQIQGDDEGQGSLACCSPWGCEELDTTWLLNNNNMESKKMVQVNLFAGDE